LKIGRSHVPVWPNALGEPVRDRPAAAADLQASATSSDSETLNPSHRQRVEALLEQTETARLVLR